MHTWSPVFYLRFLGYLLLGFGAYQLFEPDIRYLYAVYPVVWLLYIVLLRVYQRYRYSYFPLLLGILGGIILIMSGGLRLGQVEQKLQAAREARLDSVEAFQVRFLEDFRLKGKMWRGQAQVESYRREGRWHFVDAKLLLYFPAEDSLLREEVLLHGSRYIFRGEVQIIGPPSNPGTFNFQAFYKTQGLVYQHFAKSGQYYSLEPEPNPGLMGYMYTLRREMEHILQEYVPQEDNRAILSALLLGIKSGLSPEIKAVFADSGLMHILAVSGLHIGFLVWLLHLLLRKLLELPYGKGGYTCLMISLLWAYVLLTGSSPSVLRAVCMFSFILLGRVWNKRPSYFNLLAASAFYLLLYEPYLVFSVGFQLSYAAVTAILYIQPRLYRLWEPQAWPLQYLWALATVSIAAQIGTFPLSIYYFNQFPNYFLLANMLILPLVPFILYGAWALILVSVIPVLAGLWAQLLDFTLWLILEAARFIQSLPGATWDDIHWEGIQVILTYTIIILFLNQLNRPRRWVQVLLLVLGICWSTWSLRKAYIQHTQSGLGVISLYSKGLLYLYDGPEAILLYDSAHSLKKKDWEYTIMPSLHYHGIFNISPHTLSDSSGTIPLSVIENQVLIVWKNRKILWATESLYQSDISLIQRIKPDFIIISRKALPGLEEIMALSLNKPIILDNSVSSWQVEQFMKEHPSGKNKIYAVTRQGAWVNSF